MGDEGQEAEGAIIHWGSQVEWARKRRAASSGRNRGRKWRRGAARHFFKTEQDGESPSNTKDPLLSERVPCYLNSNEFSMIDPQ